MGTTEANTLARLVEQMKIVHGTVFAFYLKAHGFHWNVEGPSFPYLHSFFDSLYNDVWASIDDIAEHIRAIRAYSPGSLSRIIELSKIRDQDGIISAETMVNELLRDNQIVIDQLELARSMADAASKAGLSNFLQDRIDRHEKHGWMLRATAGRSEE